MSDPDYELFLRKRFEEVEEEREARRRGEDPSESHLDLEFFREQSWSDIFTPGETVNYLTVCVPLEANAVLENLRDFLDRDARTSYRRNDQKDNKPGTLMDLKRNGVDRLVNVGTLAKAPAEHELSGKLGGPQYSHEGTLQWWVTGATWERCGEGANMPVYHSMAALPQKWPGSDSDNPPKAVVTVLSLADLPDDLLETAIIFGPVAPQDSAHDFTPDELTGGIPPLPDYSFAGNKETYAQISFIDPPGSGFDDYMTSKPLLRDPANKSTQAPEDPLFGSSGPVITGSPPF